MNECLLKDLNINTKEVDNIFLSLEIWTKRDDPKASNDLNPGACPELPHRPPKVEPEFLLSCPYMVRQ